MRRYWTVSLMSVALSLAFSQLSLTADSQTKPAYKWEKGQEIHLIFTTTGEGSVLEEVKPGEKATKEEKEAAAAASNEPTPLKASATIDVTFKVNEVAEDGTASAEETINKVEVTDESENTTTYAGGKAKTVVQGKESEPEIPAALLTLINKPMAVKISPRGEITGPKEEEDAWLALRSLEPGLGRWIESSPPLLPVLPKELEAGGNWKQQMSLSLEELPKPLDVEVSYKLDGEEEVGQVKASKVTLKGSGEMKDLSVTLPKDPGMPAGEPDRTIKVDHLKYDLDGKLWLNAANGLPVKSEFNTAMDMKFTQASVDETDTITYKMTFKSKLEAK